MIPPTRQHFSRISLALDSDLSNHRTVHVKKTWSDVLPMRTGILGKLPFLIKHGVEKHGDERTKISNDVKDGIQRVEERTLHSGGSSTPPIQYIDLDRPIAVLAQFINFMGEQL